VRAADVVGSKGRTRVTGGDLRRRFDLRDTWAFFKAITTSQPKSGAPSGDGGGASPGASAARAGLRAGRPRLPAAPGLRGPGAVARRAQLALVAATTSGRGGAYRVEVPAAGRYRVIAGGATGPVVTVSARRRAA